MNKKLIVSTLMSTVLLLGAFPALGAVQKHRPTHNQEMFEKQVSKKGFNLKKAQRRSNESLSKESLIKQGYKFDSKKNRFEETTGFWGQVEYTYDPNSHTLTLDNKPGNSQSGDTLGNRDEHNGDPLYNPTFGTDKQLNQDLLNTVYLKMPYPVKAPDDSYNLFSWEAPNDEPNNPQVGLTNLKDIEGLKNLDTSQVTNMSFMFYGDSSLTDLDLSHFETKNVTSMRWMFAGMWDMPKFDVSSFDISKTDSDLLDLFAGDVSLQQVNGMNKWEAGDNRANVQYMFRYDRELTGADLSGFKGIEYYDGLFDNTLDSNTTLTQSLPNLSNLKLGNETSFLTAGDGSSQNPEIPTPKVGTEFELFGKKVKVSAPNWLNLDNPKQILTAEQLGQGSHPGNWVWNNEVKKATITVNYVNEKGDKLAPSATITGEVGTEYHLKPASIAGYTFEPNKSAALNGTFEKDTSLNLVYGLQTAPVIPTKYGNDGVRKHSKVYAMKGLNLYKHPDLTGQKHHYKKERRLHRPRFYVKKIVKTRRGTPRYYVKQLNKKRYGWISGNKQLVQNNYYQKRNKPVKFRIINPKGLDIYKKLTLHHKVRHLKYRMVIKARKVKKDGLQTRFYLKRGQYVSARKNFVLYK